MNTINWKSIQANNRDNVPVGSPAQTAYVNAMLGDGTPVKIAFEQIAAIQSSDALTALTEKLQNVNLQASDHTRAEADHQTAQSDHINVQSANEVVTVFASLSASVDPVRLAGKVKNVSAASTTAAVQWEDDCNASTYRVITSGGTSLKPIVGLSVRCPEFSVVNSAVEKVMVVEFLPSTADFSLTLTDADGNVCATPWVDGVEPQWQANKVYTLCISRQGASVSYRATSNLYNE